MSRFDNNKLKVNMRFNKTKSEKEKLILYIFFSIIIFIILFYFVGQPILSTYRSMQGKFTPLSFETKLNNIDYLTIYKNQNHYIFEDLRTHKIYKTTLDLEQKKFLLADDITDKIGEYIEVTQLASGNILFINFKDDNKKHQLNFKIYDWDKNKITNEFKSKAYTDTMVGNVLSFKDNDFLLLTYDRNLKSYKLLKYEKGILEETNNIYNKDIFYWENIPLENDRYLFLTKEAKSSNKFYLFNSKDNTLKEFNSGLLQEIYKHTKIKCLSEEFKIVALDNNRFLVINSKHVTTFKCINIISLFQVNNENIKEIYTKKFNNPDFNMASSSFTLFNNNKLLIVGGKTGSADFAWDRKESYKFNVKNGKLSKIADAKYIHARDKVIKVSEKSIFLYNSYSIKNNNCEIFIEELLW